MAGSNLATCQLAAWDENAVKFELKLSNEESKQKRDGGWDGRHNRSDMESVNRSGIQT